MSFDSSSMTELVRGEASESDDESDINQSNIFASEVPGEASESDEDLYEKKVPQLIHGRIITETRYQRNILQKKLIENNVAIFKGLSGFIKKFITTASKQLLNTDQLLMRSQVTLQSVLCSLKKCQINMKQLHEKTSDVFSTNFLPNINI